MDGTTVLRQLWSELCTVEDALQRMGDQLEESHIDGVGLVYIRSQHSVATNHVAIAMNRLEQHIGKLSEMLRAMQ